MHNANVAKEFQCTIGQPVKGEGLPINTEENKMDQRIVLNESILRQKSHEGLDITHCTKK